MPSSPCQLIVRSMLSAAITALAAVAHSTQAQEADIAFDMVGSSSLQLSNFANSAPSFGSTGDCFGKKRRPGPAPFAVLDDSASIFTSDAQGIIGESNTDEY